MKRVRTEEDRNKEAAWKKIAEQTDLEYATEIAVLEKHVVEAEAALKEAELEVKRKRLLLMETREASRALYVQKLKEKQKRCLEGVKK